MARANSARTGSFNKHYSPKPQNFRNNSNVPFGKKQKEPVDNRLTNRRDHDLIYGPNNFK